MVPPGKDKILIVDDEVGIRETMADILRLEGYAVDQAGCGREAVDLSARDDYAFALLDVNMPDMSGLDVLRHLRQERPDCEVSMLTGDDDLRTAIEALRLGAYDYMVKPLPNPEVVLLAIARALERRRMTSRQRQLISELGRTTQDLEHANRELETQRRRQLRSINYVGKALSAAWQRQEIVQVLIQAMLELLGGDGAAAFLLEGPISDAPWVMFGGRKRLLPTASQSLLDALLEAVPSDLRPPREQVGVERMPEQPSSEGDEAPWGRCEVSRLEIRGRVHGSVVLASHAAEAFAEDALGLLEILVTQASIALENASLFAKAQRLATRDELTALYNRRHFVELLEREISRSERYDQPLAVIMLDIDGGNCGGRGLKIINDTYGHQAGDALLKAVGAFLYDNIRRADVIARYGGDEFVILAPQTGYEKAPALANRLCRELREASFAVMHETLKITVSVGVASFRRGVGHTAALLMHLADQAMYAAKQRGGNQICVAE
jgi:diguanylate cyclase (GGDEF)-like protein